MLAKTIIREGCTAVLGGESRGRGRWSFFIFRGDQGGITYGVLYNLLYVAVPRGEEEIKRRAVTGRQCSPYRRLLGPRVLIRRPRSCIEDHRAVWVIVPSED